MTPLPTRLLALAALALLLPGCIQEGDSAPRGAADIHVVNADGSGLTNLTDDAALDAYPAWSPDGTRLAFVSGADARTVESDVYVMNVDGSGRTRLVSTPQTDHWPAWSPDGSKIAFMSLNDSLYIVGADGSGLTKVGVGEHRTTPSAGDVDFVFTPEQRPAWSPDGTKLLYSAWDPDHEFELWVVRADGTGQARLTDLPGLHDGAHAPAWSPDGSKIAFAVAGPGRGGILVGGGVCVANADGTAPTLVADVPPDTGAAPVWSPDGARLLIVSATNPLDVYVVNADGSDLTNLTGDDRENQGPVWSPDGTRIAFAALDSAANGYAIYGLHADGSGRVRLADTEGDDHQPAWSPDGTKIVFASTAIVPYTD